MGFTLRDKEKRNGNLLAPDTHAARDITDVASNIVELDQMYLSCRAAIRFTANC